MDLDYRNLLLKIHEYLALVVVLGDLEGGGGLAVSPRVYTFSGIRSDISDVVYRISRRVFLLEPPIRR